MANIKRNFNNDGFTIVELLVVIVVIGILAAITIVSYSGIVNRATIAGFQSDLDNSAKQLKMYYADHGVYPTGLDTNNCPTGTTAPSPDTNYCLKPSSGSTLAYSSIVPSAFHLTETKNTNSYSVTNNTSPAIATTTSDSTIGSVCPTNFIPVPGSGTYGTNDFCVMKYAASRSDATGSAQGSSTTPISAPGLQQWVSVSQTNAISYSANVANCSGCHLITEAEWMTIAQNVLSVDYNWSGGTVGSGNFYSGHNDNQPANALVADANNNNGYAGEFNINGTQRRTLELSNGQYIWDMAGNIWEWTNGQTTGGQVGMVGESSYSWKEWNATPMTIGSLLVNPIPSNGVPTANSWNAATNGMGRLYSNAGDVDLHSFLRGGDWSDGSYAGLFALTLDGSPGDSNPFVGFRVSK